MAEELTFTMFAELVLARVAEAEKEKGVMVFIPVRELVKELLPNIDDHWPWQAAQYLENRGLVQAALAGAGSAEIFLTPEGRIFVEQEQTALIRDYRNSPQIVVVTGDGNQVAVGHGQAVQQSGTFSKEEAVELLDEAEEKLRAGQLPDDLRDDALADLETVRTQLKKKSPNLGVMKAALPALRAIDDIAGIAEKLQHLIH